MQVFTGSLLLGKIVPIIYFVMVIPAVLYSLVSIFKIALSVRENTSSSLRDGKELANLPSSGESLGYWDGPRLMDNIVLGVAILLLFACNFALGNITAKLTINSSAVNYSETTFTHGKADFEMPYSNINFVCEESGSSYLNGGNKYWVFSDGHGGPEISTARIDQQEKLLSVILTRNPHLKLNNDGSSYSQKCYKSDLFK